MESIVIEIDDVTAKKWQAVSPKIKDQMVSQGINEARFEALLDRASDEATKNGLTEEILQKLLNEE